jgi:hypothetical protein
MYLKVDALPRTFRGMWTNGALLTATGLLMLVVLIGAGVGLVVDARTITGAPAWLKPAKFAASIAIYTLTLAWVFTHLDDWPRTRRVVSAITAVTLVLEIIIIAFQAWRGTTSHFNVGTPFDLALWATMGWAIVVQTLTSVAIAVALWRQRFSDPALGWALRLGMVITIVGASTGGLMTLPTSTQIAQAQSSGRMATAGAHTVGAPDGGPGLAGTRWSLEHGDIRVAHFVGLHALQAMLLVFLVLSRLRVPERTMVKLIAVAGTSYITLFAILLWQALRGQALIQPDVATLAALAVWATGTATAAWAGGAYRGMPGI